MGASEVVELGLLLLLSRSPARGKVVLEAGVDCRDVGVYRSTCGCGCGCRWLKCLCLVALLLAYISLISNYKNGKLHSIAVALSQWDNRRAGAWIYASQLALSPSPPLALSLSPSLPVLRV